MNIIYEFTTNGDISVETYIDVSNPHLCGKRFYTQDGRSLDNGNHLINNTLYRVYYTGFVRKLAEDALKPTENKAIEDVRFKWFIQRYRRIDLADLFKPKEQLLLAPAETS